MTPMQMRIVGLRLLAVYFAVTSAVLFFQGISASSSSHHWEYIGYIVYSAAMLCISAIFYRYAPFIAKSLLRDTPADVPAQSITPEEWFVMGCSMLGLWFSTKSIPSIAEELYILATNPHNTLENVIGEMNSDLRLRYYGIQLCFGILLVLGRKGIARVLAKARGLDRH